MNLKCQSMKELLNFLDLLPLQSNHSFMPMVPGLVFFMCDSGAMEIEVGERDSIRVLAERSLVLSASLF